MYFHPLQEDIANLSDEDISKRIKELSRKVNTAKRFGRNPQLLADLQLALRHIKTRSEKDELRNGIRIIKKLEVNQISVT